ncbi:DUF3861 domain-containing protein [Microvirga sp. W0021]|uniref:DUF3861 domain-containing protein n=1 Tax=Hohaiivirga grylli TaxID=3133970 RepID=A0ABV0BIG3_9HYPH
MKQNHYKITVEQQHDKDGNAVSGKQIAFNARNHDDLLFVVEKIKGLNIANAEDSTAMAVGLKLFTEIVLENKNEPVFKELFPLVRDIMQHIKSGMK